MTNAIFDDRLSLIERRHRRLANGAVYRVGRDGLITAQPRERLAPRLPGRSLVFLLLAAMALKAALYLGLGASTYEGRLDQLRTGSDIERAAHWIMQIDPITARVADTILDIVG